MKSVDELKVTVLVVGVDSLIGSSLAVFLKSKDFHVIGTSRKKSDENIFLDLDGPLDISILPDVHAVYLCAAVNGFEACNVDPVMASMVNIVSTIAIGKHYMARGSYVVFLSSSSVFGPQKTPRNEEDIPAPISVYGAFKRSVELAFLDMADRIGDRCAVVRITKVISQNIKLLQSWFDLNSSGQAINALTDYYLSPVSVDYVVNSLYLILHHKGNGVFHLSGSEAISYFDLASEFARRNLLQARLLNPKKCGEIAHSRLGNLGFMLSMERTKRILNISPQSLSDFYDDIFFH